MPLPFAIPSAVLYIAFSAPSDPCLSSSDSPVNVDLRATRSSTTWHLTSGTNGDRSLASNSLALCELGDRVPQEIDDILVTNPGTSGLSDSVERTCIARLAPAVS